MKRSDRMKVFIAHSSRDHDFVLPLAERLNKDLKGADIWIDDWELQVGDSIVYKINEGLETSSFLIIVFSEHSLRSDWVSRELNSTLMRQLTIKDIKILPIHLEIKPAALPPLFSDMFAAKFSRQSMDRTQYEKLIEPIRKKVKSDELAKYQDRYFENIVHVDLVLDKSEPTRHEVEFILRLIQEKHYGNYFFKKITAVFWFYILKRAGYFAPDKAPGPQPADREGSFIIPDWNVLRYLERVSQQVSKPGNEKYIDELLDIIKDVSMYKDAEGNHIDNYRIWWYFIKILLNLPNDKITQEIINLIPVWLDAKYTIASQGVDIARKLLPKFLFSSATPEDIHKAEIIINHMTAFKMVPLSEERAKLLDGKEEKATFAIDAHWLKEAFKKYALIIGEKCTRRVVDDLVNKLSKLLRRKEDGTYTSLHDESKYLREDPLEILIFILQKILLAKAKNDVNTTRRILMDFLHDDFLIFPKIAIYVISQDVDNYKDVFWEVLDTSIGDIIMEETLYFGDELKHLLKNLKGLSDEQKKKLYEKIEQVAGRHIFREDSERNRALYKQQIYQALSHEL